MIHQKVHSTQYLVLSTKTQTPDALCTLYSVLCTRATGGRV